MKSTSFPAFFQSLWGYAPFDWQTRLLERVATDGWPSTLDLPTGAGKTATLDIAVFALALDAAKPAAERKQPRRIVLVVDRRVVVDQAFERAAEIAKKLDEAKSGILAEVAEALRSLAGNPEGLPILPAILRGGMPREAEWAKSPSQPVILTSTVDQVGSRLLFRGYGVSERMRPVHAGLLGCDTLLLLDEVHLARPFEDTLTAITRFYTNRETDGLTRPLRFVRMSATVATPASDTFGLSDNDRNTERLRRRLVATKSALLRQVSTPRDDAKASEALAKAALREAQRLSKSQARAIAVIVNRVETAKRVAIQAKDSLGDDWDVSLLTGRMRPLDRLENQASVLDRVRSGRERKETSPRLLLVSTQAIEAGADFDFDALITECASLDALRQRFGRLDRLGDLGSTEAVILAGSSNVDEKAETDPIYGSALRDTWRFLNNAATPSSDAPVIDFGIAAMDSLLEPLTPSEKSALVAPRGVAPILTSSHLDRWVQTSPAPHADPEVGPFLHGIDRGAAEVQVVWRADLELGDLNERSLPVLQAMLELVRPSSLEALSVPLWAAQQWLGCVHARAQQADVEVSKATMLLTDVEGASMPGVDDTPIELAVAWRGGMVSLITNPDDLKPGLTIVVPSSYGGLDARFACWDPASTSPVADRGDEAQLLQKGRAVLRWDTEVIKGWATSSSSAVQNGPTVADDELEERGATAERAAFLEWRDVAMQESTLPLWVRVVLKHIEKGSRTERVELDLDGKTRVWRAQTRNSRVPPKALRELLGMPELRHAPIVGEPAEPATEEDEGSFLGSPISLSRHLEGVRDYAKRFSVALSLPEPLTSDLALSGWIHDLGKADQRFQLLLHGGDAVREAAASELLAKSALTATDRKARERGRERSGYPKGMRHELLSVGLVQESAAVRKRAHDWDLVLHLVASHHGWCRPFAHPVIDPDPREVSVIFEGTTLTSSSAHGLERFDAAVPERFWELVRRYGYWGLAWLEAVLRLADHRESEDHSGSERESPKEQDNVE